MTSAHGVQLYLDIVILRFFYHISIPLFSMSARSEVIIFPQNKKIIIIFVYEITFAKLFWYSLNIIQWQFPCLHLARTFFTWQCTAFWSSWYSWVNNMSHFHLGWEKVADEKKSDVKPWLKLLPVKMGTSCILNICSLQFSRLPRVVQEKLLVWRFQIQSENVF